MTPHLLITPGEPAGIGPDITVQIAQHDYAAALTVIADPDLLQARAELLKLPLTIREYDPSEPAKKHQAGTLSVLPVKLNVPSLPGILNAANADYVLCTLSLAASLCKQKQANGVVTGPVHKEIINQAGIPFYGHTEFFADSCNVKQTVMLFIIDQVKIALATTHLALKNVPAAITKEHLEKVITILHNDLKKYFQIKAPRILICGLNPHAGEGGYLGREEIDVMMPTIATLRASGYDLSDPLSADTIFTPKHLEQADAILAMYHDQALPVVKYMGFGHAVNMTLGLPFIRTSVDHGTALDLAGTGKADAGSLDAAISLATRLT